MSDVYRCAVCDNTRDNRPFQVREMFFGTRDEFTYFECADCGCVQITEIPTNLADYYPAGYFSLRDYSRLARSRFRSFVDTRRLRNAMGQPSLIGRLVDAVSTPLNYVEWVRIAGVDTSARVLDVGCGGGKLLVRMRHAGFAECRGIDPFIKAPLRYENGVTVEKREIAEVADERPGSFDFVMLHHAYEHMPDPRGVMKALARLLAPGGRMLIRIPVADSYAFEHYREHWINLDPPRHLYLHTRKSMGILARSASLAVDRVVCDSTALQFIGSELYVKGLVHEEPSDEKRRLESRRPEFEARAAELNREGKGDFAAYYLSRSESKATISAAA